LKTAAARGVRFDEMLEALIRFRGHR
jgi:hypothetical protein